MWAKEGPDILAVVATEGGLVPSLGGLVDRAGLLGVVGDALLTVGVDSDGLVVDETSVLFKETKNSSALLSFDCVRPCLCQYTPWHCYCYFGSKFRCVVGRTLRECLFVKLKGSREN